MLKHTDKIHQQQNGGSHNMQTINTSFPDLSYLIGRIDDIRRYIEILQAQIEHRDKHMSLLLEELAAQRRIIEKKDEQIETLTKKKL